MDMYPDYIVKAIRRKFAPDIMSALRDASPMTFSEPSGSVTVPMQAGVKILYDKGVSTFIVDAVIKGCKHSDSIWWDDIGGRQVFSLREIKSAKDRVALISYLFDQAKEQFIRKLIDDELEYILKDKTESTVQEGK